VKKYYRLIIVMSLCMLLLFPSFAYAGEEAVHTVTLEGALQMAYTSNPDIRKADLELEKAQINRDDARDTLEWIPTGGLIDPTVNQVFNLYQQTEIGLSTAKKAQESEKDRITQQVITTYTKALKDFNIMESTRLTLDNLEHQKRIAGVSMGLGLMSEIGYQKLESSIKQAQEGFKAAQAGYEGSMAALRYLLGQNAAWNPVLSSRAILDTYTRNELSVELNRGTSESVLVWTKKALLDIEKSKETWFLPNTSSDLKKVDLHMAEVSYEQAKRDAKAKIEQLYYGIDAVEGQIQAAEVALATAQKDLEITQLKYDVGAIPRYSMTGTDSLSAAEVAAETARMDLENLKADLAQMKAQFAYLTGQTPYDPGDWTIVD
jgi:outer membrane protein TolC